MKRLQTHAVRVCARRSAILTIAVVAAFASGCTSGSPRPSPQEASLHGIVGIANMSGEWNKTLVAAGFEAMGYHVTVIADHAVLTGERHHPTYVEHTRAERQNGTSWRFIYSAGFQPGISAPRDEMPTVVEREWRAIEPEFQDVLARFENATDRQATGTYLSPGIVVVDDAR